MSKDIFEKRGSALEDEFFRRVDVELAKKLKDKWQQERDIELLRAESRIQDNDILQELLNIGIEPATLQAMMLIPAIHVAWANGFVETKERGAVLNAASSIGINSGSTTGQLLTSWLNQKPSKELFQAWEDYVRALKDVVDVTAYRHLHETAVNTAGNIAKSAGGTLGVHAVSLAEQRAIKQIDAAFC